VAGRDITEPILHPIGIESTGAIWQNTDIAYDVALGGMPFILATNDARPKLRGTAPFKKDQFDNGAEAGEASLTGWWLRSQMSFHSGEGIKFYDPATTAEVGHYRFAESEGLDVWTKGETKLLNKTNIIGYPAAGLQSNGRSTHHTSSIKWTVSGTLYQGVLDGGDFNIVRVTNTGAIQPLVVLTGTQDKIYSMCNDGEYVYYIVNEVSGSLKMHMYKKSLNAAVGDAPTLMFNNSVVVSNSTMAYIKERIVAGVNNGIYELTAVSSSLPTAVYAHPTASHIWSSVAASGSAIYVSGWNGLLSSIVKFTLTTSGTMPTLTSAITTAELPDGERIYALRYYLGRLMIGTLKGVRAASISENDGSVIYGPLIVETHQPVFGFASRQSYVWCASGTTTGKQGLIRIDLSNELEPLRYAYANDLQISTPIDGGQTVSVGFLGETDEIFFSNCSSAGRVTQSITNKQLTDNVATLTTATAHSYMVGQAVYITGVGAPFDSAANFPVGSHKIITAVSTDMLSFSYAVTNADIASTAVSPAGTAFAAGTACIESATELTETGYLTTGNIRYNTLEPKNFKRLLGRGDFTYGSMSLQTVDAKGVQYDHITYDAGIEPVEVTTSSPSRAQEYVAYKFVLARHGADVTKGPVFKGYQAKSTIATPRQRVMQFYVYNMDVETDRYNVEFGYNGRAFERQMQLEDIEESGDIITYQDLNTGESRQVQIENIQLMGTTPPDKENTGFGGILQITIRTV